MNTEHLKHTPGAIGKLNELADRGIILNEWQANTYLGSNRGTGKTFLSYVRLLESIDKDSTIISVRDGIRFDPDAVTRKRQYTWMEGLIDFIEKYYSDTFIVGRVGRMQIVISERVMTPDSKRWWL